MMNFEQNLHRVNNLSASLDSQVYQNLPKDWWVVITDIVSSSLAIEQGRYRDVNAVGGSTVAAVLNAAKPHKIPYSFGGDGAVFCIPPELLPKIKQALKACEELAHDGLKLELRIGLIPSAELTQPIQICRYQAAPNLIQYFFIGGGMEEAETLTKATNHYHLDPKTQANGDFSGFECRWNEIPSKKDLTFSLIIKARCKTQADSLKLYQTLIQQTHILLGDIHQHHPLNSSGLSLSMDHKKLRAEVATKTQTKQAWQGFWIRQKIRLQNLIGHYWMKHNIQALGINWGHYKQELIQHSDYIKLDDSLRFVMSADQSAINQLIDWLEQQYQANKLYYGYHQSHSAIITCLVEKTGQNHIHFVDSAEGGYALAAKKLKQQIALSSLLL